MDFCEPVADLFGFDVSDASSDPVKLARLVAGKARTETKQMVEKIRVYGNMRDALIIGAVKMRHFTFTSFMKPFL